MRLLLPVLVALIGPSGAADARCFDECFGSKIQTTSDDIAAKDYARECRETCDAESEARLDQLGVAARVKACRAEPLTLDQFRKVRGASPSYRVQSNIFLWDVVNPFPDKVLTKIAVSTQTMEMQELSFVGTGLVPPSSVATFVVPSFYEGYPAVRFAAKVKTIWACDVR